MTEFCKRCDKTLRDDVSRALGYGPECRKHIEILESATISLRLETERAIALDHIRHWLSRNAPEAGRLLDSDIALGRFAA